MKKLAETVPNQTESLPQLIDKSNTLSEKRAETAKLAKLLLGCYRTGDANDPEVYAAAIVAVLADYPIDVVRQIVDPRTGIPSRCKWLPAVSEIKEACQKIMRERYEEINRSTAALTLTQQMVDAAIEDRSTRKTYEEIKAEFEAVGIKIGEKSQSCDISAEAMKQRYGVSDEQWNAIPDLPPSRIGAVDRIRKPCPTST